MSPVQHPVSGPSLQFSLENEIRSLEKELSAAPSRSARTLVKEGPLRIMIVAVSPGGELRPHKAEGPISVQVLEGEIDFQVEGGSWKLPRGTLFMLGAGITHSVRSPKGGVFLLTVVGATDESAATQSAARQIGGNLE